METMFLKEPKGDSCRPNELRTPGSCGRLVRKMRGKNVREKYNEDTAGERILKKKMIKRTVELPREKQAEFPFMKSLVINLPFFPGSSKRQKRQQM